MPLLFQQIDHLIHHYIYLDVELMQYAYRPFLFLHSLHLHQDLKFALGYYQTRASEFGGVMYVPDSIAMYRMDQAEFNVFFEQAMAKLAEAIGTDPLELINAKTEG